MMIAGICMGLGWPSCPYINHACLMPEVLQHPNVWLARGCQRTAPPPRRPRDSRIVRFEAAAQLLCEWYFEASGAFYRMRNADASRWRESTHVTPSSRTVEWVLEFLEPPKDRMDLSESSDDDVTPRSLDGSDDYDLRMFGISQALPVPGGDCITSGEGISLWYRRICYL